MTPAHRRHDITDQIWERLQPHLPGGAGKRGRPAPGQPPVSGRGVLEPAHWRSPVSGTGQAVVGPATGLWGLEEHPSPLLSLAGPGRLGRFAGPGSWTR